MKNNKNGSIIKLTDLEPNTNEVNNTSSDSLSQNEVQNNNRIITESSRSILKFYRDNKSIILLKEKDFKEWLISKYLVYVSNNKFIATENSVENGYMINSQKAIIDLEKLTCCISYGAKITQKGQNYILDYFEEVNNERQN